MSVTIPTPAQLQVTAAKMGLSLTDSDVASFLTLMQANVEAYNVVERLPDYLPQASIHVALAIVRLLRRTNITLGTIRPTLKARGRASSKVKLWCSKIT